MNFFAELMLDGHHFRVAEIGCLDGDLIRQFWEARTAIWTQKYPEPIGVDGRERDAHDEMSSYLVLVEGEMTVVGGTRIIYADNGNNLPVASCSRLPIDGRATEVSRFFMQGDLNLVPSDAELVFRLFIYGIASFLKGQGYERSYATIRSSLFKKVSELGVPMVRIGPDQGHGAKTFVPAMMFESEHAHFEQPSSPQRLAA